jgi:imidazolonepropionase-like amidohydrolase
MAGPAIENGVVVIRDGKIAAVGSAGQVTIPDGFKVLQAAVVTPGLIDAHSVVGLTGIYNQDHDQDQLESSNPIQPELRAIDAYNPQEELIGWLRGFGITTVHTGHAPGELISGQTMIIKTVGNSVGEAVIVPTVAVAATLGPAAQKSEGKAPGTRGKEVAMLRSELIKAQEYAKKRETAEQDKKPDRDLKLDALGRVLSRELPLMITVQRAQDIASALRLAEEFSLRIWLDGAAEAYLLIDPIKAAGVPVIIHPSMQRAWGEMENMSFETAAKLRAAGIPIAMQSGFEDYVPKTRVVLFEAAISAANGLSFEQALAAITIDAAKILGVAERVGSLEVGKDGDVALYDGDPFEYTSHCTGVIIDGKVVSETPR